MDAGEAGMSQRPAEEPDKEQAGRGVICSADDLGSRLIETALCAPHLVSATMSSVEAKGSSLSKSEVSTKANLILAPPHVLLNTNHLPVDTAASNVPGILSYAEWHQSGFATTKPYAIENHEASRPMPHPDIPIHRTLGWSHAASRTTLD
jgi:hypothetical protein